MSNVTIGDIAKLLGVSKSTVSRALKNHPDISAETIKSVKEVAKELKYIPNLMASSLRSGKSNLIGLVIPQISYFFFPSVIHAIEKVVKAKGYNLLIMNSEESYEREVENLEILKSNSVEGILVSVTRKTESFKHFENMINDKVPIVFFDRVVDELKVDKVLLDDFEGAYKAVNHLIEIGRKRLAVFIGSPKLLISRNRLLGYKKALFEHRIPFDEDLVYSCESPEEAELAMNDLLKSQQVPDGIFSISDLTLSGIMKSAFKNKIKIPEQIAIIGFSEEPLSSMYSPTISRVKPMGYEMGECATELLFKNIAHVKLKQEREAQTIYLDAELILGASTMG